MNGGSKRSPSRSGISREPRQLGCLLRKDLPLDMHLNSEILDSAGQRAPGNSPLGGPARKRSDFGWGAFAFRGAWVDL